jgi:hypothetical protein
MQLVVANLLYFGTGGLFLFKWTGHNLIAQISHLFMTAAAFHTIYWSWVEMKSVLDLLGLFVGVIATVIIVKVHKKYAKAYEEDFKKLFEIEMPK